MTTSRRSNWKVLLVGLAVLAVSVLVAYFAGRGLERSAAHTQAEVAARSLAGANARAAALHARVDLLAANVWVYKATTALDNRNFGLANDAMANAVTRLRRIEAGPANVEPGALATVQSDAAALRINVATDLQPQRAALLKLAASVTALADDTSSPSAAR